jgi:hypothetical protein
LIFNGLKKAENHGHKIAGKISIAFRTALDLVVVLGSILVENEAFATLRGI